MEEGAKGIMGYLAWILIVQAVACAGFCRELARQKGHDANSWMMGGFFFSIIALIAAAGLPDLWLRPNHDDKSEAQTELSIPQESR
jgi:hypothetical protein